MASLESFNDSLCAEVWKARDRAEILRSLIRRNLLTPSGRKDGAELRMHPLFRDFLLERAREALPQTERARLLETLGHRLMDSDPAAGLEQWSQIPAPRLVAEWLTGNGARFLREGRHSWLDGLL